MAATNWISAALDTLVVADPSDITSTVGTLGFSAHYLFESAARLDASIEYCCIPEDFLPLMRIVLEAPGDGEEDTDKRRGSIVASILRYARAQPRSDVRRTAWLCLEIGDDSHVTAMRHLIRAGADTASVQRTGGRSMLETAIDLGKTSLALAMIRESTVGQIAGIRRDRNGDSLLQRICWARKLSDDDAELLIKAVLTHLPEDTVKIYAERALRRPRSSVKTSIKVLALDKRGPVFRTFVLKLFLGAGL